VFATLEIHLIDLIGAEPDIGNERGVKGLEELK